MKKTDKKTIAFRIFRRAIQLAFFILLPGLFISAFGALKDVYTAAVSGSFSFSALSYQLILLAAVIPVTALLGRFFCGYMCAFGSMGDFIWFLSSHTCKKKSLTGEKADRILKYFKYAFLVFLVVAVWTFGAIKFGEASNPWTIFGMYASLSGWPGTTYLLTVGAALLLVIIVGSFFVERFFCRYCCPLGAVFSLVSLVRPFKIKKARAICGACTLCTAKCPMGIPLYKDDVICSGECIDCFTCVQVCPKKNVKANPKPAVATAVAAAAIAGLYYVGNLTQTDASGAVSSGISAGQTAQKLGPYQDGTYTGSARGFRGTTSVSVTVKNGYIDDIAVLSTGDDRQYFYRAENTIISAILAAQSTNVSAVTGATFSSNGLISAVSNALGI